MTGERVGRFIVTDLLGRGATSVGGRAIDSDAPNDRSRDVAVKRLAVPESAADRERLAREAEVLAKLDHANVIRVREVVPDGPGIALILDLADGGTLADRLRESGPRGAPSTAGSGRRRHRRCPRSRSRPSRCQAGERLHRRRWPGTPG